MTDVSNRLLVGLLMAALLVMVGSTFIMVGKLSNLAVYYNIFTGAATDTSSQGEVNITVQPSTALTLQTPSQIGFGVGRVNSSCNGCGMDSNATKWNYYTNGSNLSSNTLNTAATGSGPAPCCVNFTNVQSGFLLENTGNVNISIGYTCSLNCSHYFLLGGSRTGSYLYAAGGSVAFSPFMIRAAPNNIAKQSGESGTIDVIDSCRGGGSLYRDSGLNVTNTTSYLNASDGGTLPSGRNVSAGFIGWAAEIYAPFSPYGHWLCGNNSNSPLMPDNDQDAIVVDINLTVFTDSPATSAASTARLVFNGTSQ